MKEDVCTEVCRLLALPAYELVEVCRREAARLLHEASVELEDMDAAYPTRLLDRASHWLILVRAFEDTAWADEEAEGHGWLETERGGGADTEANREERHRQTEPTPDH